MFLLNAPAAAFQLDAAAQAQAPTFLPTSMLHWLRMNGVVWLLAGEVRHLAPPCKCCAVLQGLHPECMLRLCGTWPVGLIAELLELLRGLRLSACSVCTWCDGLSAELLELLDCLPACQALGAALPRPSAPTMAPLLAGLFSDLGCMEAGAEAGLLAGALYASEREGERCSK